jgi:hypothetical protein
MSYKSYFWICAHHEKQNDNMTLNFNVVSRKVNDPTAQRIVGYSEKSNLAPFCTFRLNFARRAQSHDTRRQTHMYQEGPENLLLTFSDYAEISRRTRVCFRQSDIVRILTKELVRHASLIRKRRLK